MEGSWPETSRNFTRLIVASTCNGEPSFPSISGAGIPYGNGFTLGSKRYLPCVNDYIWNDGVWQQESVCIDVNTWSSLKSSVTCIRMPRFVEIICTFWSRHCTRFGSIRLIILLKISSYPEVRSHWARLAERWVSSRLYENWSALCTQLLFLWRNSTKKSLVWIKVWQFWRHCCLLENLEWKRREMPTYAQCDLKVLKSTLFCCIARI